MTAIATAQIAPLAESIARRADPKALSALDAAWAQADNSVIRASRLLGKPYGTTLRMLTAPEAKLLSPDDPRVAAHSIALAELESGRGAPSNGKDEAMRVILERNATRELAAGRNEDKAWKSLVVVAQHEIARDAEMLAARNAQKAAAPSKRGDQGIGLV